MIDWFILDQAVVLCQLDSMKPCIAVKDISYRQLKSVDMDTLRANLMRSELCTNLLSNLDMMVSSGLSLIFQVAVKKDTSRQGIKHLGILFGAIFLLFSYQSRWGSCSYYPGKIANPWPLMT